MNPKAQAIKAMCFNNGNIAVFDVQGNQIPELQESWPALWAKHAEKLGYDPDGVVFELQSGGAFRIFRTEDGGYNSAMWPPPNVPPTPAPEASPKGAGGRAVDPDWEVVYDNNGYLVERALMPGEYLYRLTYFLPVFLPTI